MVTQTATCKYYSRKHFHIAERPCLRGQNCSLRRGNLCSRADSKRSVWILHSSSTVIALLFTKLSPVCSLAGFLYLSVSGWTKVLRRKSPACLKFIIRRRRRKCSWVQSLDITDIVLPKRNQSHWPVIELLPEKLSLRDLFLQLYNRLQDRRVAGLHGKASLCSSGLTCEEVFTSILNKMKYGCEFDIQGMRRYMHLNLFTKEMIYICIPQAEPRRKL